MAYSDERLSVHLVVVRVAGEEEQLVQTLLVFGSINEDDKGDELPFKLETRAFNTVKLTASLLCSADRTIEDNGSASKL